MNRYLLHFSVILIDDTISVAGRKTLILLQKYQPHILQFLTTSISWMRRKVLNSIIDVISVNERKWIFSIFFNNFVIFF